MSPVFFDFNPHERAIMLVHEGVHRYQDIYNYNGPRDVLAKDAINRVPFDDAIMYPYLIQYFLSRLFNVTDPSLVVHGHPMHVAGQRPKTTHSKSSGQGRQKGTRPPRGRASITPRKRLEQFWKFPGHEGTGELLRAWYTHVNSKTISWRAWGEVNAPFAGASIVGDDIVFNIGGNKYRLVSRNRYATQKVFVVNVMTHGEYDEDKWKDECGGFELPPLSKQKKTTPTRPPTGRKRP